MSDIRKHIFSHNHTLNLATLSQICRDILGIDEEIDEISSLDKISANKYKNIVIFLYTGAEDSNPIFALDDKGNANITIEKRSFYIHLIGDTLEEKFADLLGVIVGTYFPKPLTGVRGTPS